MWYFCCQMEVEFFGEKKQNKRLGQVFLKDQNVLNKIVESAQISSEEVVVEIGCGQGWLSLNLAKRCRKLYIIEIDPYYMAETQERLKEFSNVQFISGDVIRTGFGQIEEPRFKIVANLPYQISAAFVKLLITEKLRIKETVLMVQDEFAKKLVSKPGEGLYSSLGVYASYFLLTEYLFKVSRSCFRPVPRVDSAVIRIRSLEAPPFEVEEEVFFSLVRSAFWGRRKTLVSCLSKSPYIKMDSAFKQLPFFQKNATIRGEILSLQQFYEVYQVLKEAGLL